MREAIARRAIFAMVLIYPELCRKALYSAAPDLLPKAAKALSLNLKVICMDLPHGINALELKRPVQQLGPISVCAE